MKRSFFHRTIVTEPLSKSLSASSGSLFHVLTCSLALAARTTAHIGPLNPRGSDEFLARGFPRVRGLTIFSANAHGRKSMRDQNAGAAFGQFRKRFENRLFRFGIEGGGGLVQG